MNYGFFTSTGTLYLCIVLLLLCSCGIYDNKYSQGLIKTPSDTTFYFQPVSLTWTQSFSENDFGGTFHSILLHNNSGVKIDSLQVIAIAYKNNDRNFSNIIFLAPIKFTHVINASPSNSATQIFERTESVNTVGREAYLLNSPPIMATPVNGFYTGYYELYKSGKVITRKIAHGVIDYSGKMNLIIDSNLISRFQGIIDEKGEYTYIINKPDNSELDNGTAMVSISKSILTFKVKITTPSTDSIAFSLNLIK